MLALVTCHIFPPSIWYGKKMNYWHLTSRLTARSFSESTASRVRSGRCPRQCATLLHGQMYLQEKTPVLQFGHTLEQNSSICPSISYLWMVDLVMRFFSCGASLWRSSTRIRPKKGPAPWILFLTPAPRPLQVTFFWLVKLNICGCTPFARTNVFSEKKRLFCNLGALTQNSRIRPIMSYLWMIGLEMRLFSYGPTFEDYPQVFSQKKVQPLGFYFWHLRLGLFKSLFWLVKLNMCVCTLLQGQLYFQQKNMCFAIWARVDTKFLNSAHHVLSVDYWPGDATFFLWANLWRSSASIQSKKVQPLGFYFWPLRLCLLKSLFWLVKVNICGCTPFAKSFKKSYPLN